MRRLKKILCAVLSLCLIAGIAAAAPVTLKAASKGSAPAKVHIYAETANSSAIRVNFANPGDKVKNIKTNSGNLKAFVTSVYTSNYSTSSDNPGYAYIGLRSKAAGTYEVTFDLCTKKGKKIKSYKTTVYANNDTAIKSVTIGGKAVSDEVPNSGKLVVSMNSGYKIKSIAMRTYNAKGEEVTKKIKNNSKITLGKYAYKYEYDYEYPSTDSEGNETTIFSKSLSTRILATTTIEITYKDKYTKQDMISTWLFSRVSE